MHSLEVEMESNEWLPNSRKPRILESEVVGISKIVQVLTHVWYGKNLNLASSNFQKYKRNKRKAWKDKKKRMMAFKLQQVA